MKILLVNSLGYEAGGAEVSIIRLKKELIKKGHEVKILTSDYNTADSTFADYTFKHTRGVFQLFFRLFNPYSYIALKKVLKEYQPNIVHFNRMDFISPSVLFLVKYVPTAMTLHGPEDFITSLLIWFMPNTYFKNNIISKNTLKFRGKIHYFYHAYIQKYIYNISLKNVDVFISPSKGFAKYIDKNIKPVITVPNGIKLMKYSKKSTCEYKLLYVGRLDSTKGIDFAIKALPIILKTFPQTTLTIIGEGTFKNELVKLTYELNLEDNVKFVTWQTKKKIEHAYRNSDIVILTSIWPEPFGLVGLEAMSVGRPIIATKVGGIPEWLEDGKTGFLIEPKNSQQIARKIIELFANKKLLINTRKNARKRAEEFTLEKQATNLEKTYCNLVEGNPPSKIL